MIFRTLHKRLALLLASLRFQLGADDEAGYRKRKKRIGQKYRAVKLDEYGLRPSVTKKRLAEGYTRGAWMHKPVLIPPAPPPPPPMPKVDANETPRGLSE